MNLNYIPALMVFFVVGCGTYLPRHEKPKTDVTARLRYAIGMQEGSLYMFDDKQCSQNGKNVAHLRSGFAATLHGVNQKMIGIPAQESIGNRLLGETVIDAGKPLYFAAFGANNNYLSVSTCRGFFGFSPKEGHDYEITLDSSPPNCHLRVMELIRSSEGGYSRIPVEALPTSKSDCPAAYDKNGGFR